MKDLVRILAALFVLRWAGSDLHVQRNQYQDRLHDHHLERLKDVFIDNFFQIGFLLFHWSMKSPVLRFEPELLRSSFEQDWGEGFWDDEEGEKAECAGHDQSEPGCPAPSVAG